MALEPELTSTWRGTRIARRYSQWGSFLKARRNLKFRSAREFCTQTGLKISYPQYSRYESGEQLPHIDQAISIFKLLDVPLMEGLLEWNRAQMNSIEAQNEIEIWLKRWREERPVSEHEISKEAPRGISLDDVIVFNRSHLEVFESSPWFRDIFTYINSFSPDAVSASEISRALGMNKKEANSMLDQLIAMGVITRQEDSRSAEPRFKASKPNFYFPDDQDFFELRNQNFTHNVSEVLKRLSWPDLAARRAHRGLITRELTGAQLRRLIQMAEKLLEEAVEMPESRSPEKVYSLCILLGERFQRALDRTPFLSQKKQNLSANKENSNA